MAVALALAVVILYFILPGLWPFGSVAPSGEAAAPMQAATTTDTTTSPTAQTAPTTMPPVTQPITQLRMKDDVVGTGAVAAAGDTVVVEYTGALTNGTVFDSSVGKPAFAIPGVTCPTGSTTGLCLTLGAGQVIKGWDEGIVGMKEGGTRTLLIPASLAYGSQSPSPSIPANSNLVFQVQLLKVQKAASAQ
ncbi:MAG TPA: FKBP-type peptidyl-prolyl cis-trans isomerase [Candidatus Paceibacterota bacterium]|nr:FKBP-type peptidyl-prolyl cis-trans isomerase [Candidatus Paceibacterota bacterium]